MPSSELSGAVWSVSWESSAFRDGTQWLQQLWFALVQSCSVFSSDRVQRHLPTKQPASALNSSLYFYASRSRWTRKHCKLKLSTNICRQYPAYAVNSQLGTILENLRVPWNPSPLICTPVAPKCSAECRYERRMEWMCAGLERIQHLLVG